VARGLHRFAVTGGLWLALATSAAAQEPPRSDPTRTPPTPVAPVPAPAMTPTEVRPAAVGVTPEAGAAPPVPAAAAPEAGAAAAPTATRPDTQQLRAYLDARRDERGRRCELHEVVAVEAL